MSKMNSAVTGGNGWKADIVRPAELKRADD